MAEVKAVIVKSLLEVKKSSGKSYNKIAEETGLTSVYVGQLLRRQAQLKHDTASKLHAALPGLTKEQLKEMMEAPLRSFDPSIIQDPTIYRLNEGMMHFGESIKDIVNEEFGDGIMSAIDFHCSVDKIKGYDGKERVVLTFDRKYLHICCREPAIKQANQRRRVEKDAQTTAFCFNKATWEFFAC